MRCFFLFAARIKANAANISSVDKVVLQNQLDQVCREIGQQIRKKNLRKRKKDKEEKPEEKPVDKNEGVQR